MNQRDDELLRHLGTLWRTAVVGLSTLREVAVRSTQTGRLRVDIALLQRERSQILETLGEMVVALVDEGSFDDAPESVRQAVERIKDVEARIKNDTIRTHDNSFGAPRGYEPEAATDYGDDEFEPAPAPARKSRAASTRSTGARATKKATPAKRKANQH